jgi:spore germination cell wall hydrolase CwlJ-like protein
MKPALQKIYDANLRDFGSLTNEKLLALTIWGEARGEIYTGKVGVASVIMERVDHRDWDGKNIKEVCLWPYQFSCYLPKDPNRPKMLDIAQNWDLRISKDKSLQECFAVAQGLLSSNIPRNPIALQYFDPRGVTETPKWAFTMKYITTIGHHKFYN